MGVGRRCRCSLDRGDFIAKPLQFIVERGLVGQHGRELLVAFAQFFLKRFELSGRLQ